MKLPKNSAAILVLLVAVWIVSGINLYAAFWKRQPSSATRSRQEFAARGHNDVQRIWRPEDEVASKQKGKQSEVKGSSRPPQHSHLLEAHAHYPAWVHGHWLLIQHHHHGQQKVIDLLSHYMFTLHVPVTTIVLDAHWAHPLDMLKWHPDLYPDPDSFMTMLSHTFRVKVVLWFSGLVSHRDKRYKQMLASGVFLQDRASLDHCTQVLDPIDTGKDGEMIKMTSEERAAKKEVAERLKCKPVTVQWEHGDSPSLEGAIIDFSLSPRAETLTHSFSDSRQQGGGDGEEGEHVPEWFENGHKVHPMVGKAAAEAQHLYQDFFKEMVDFTIRYGVDGIRAGGIDAALFKYHQLYSPFGGMRSLKNQKDAGSWWTTNGHHLSRNDFSEIYYSELHLASVLGAAPVDTRREWFAKDGTRTAGEPTPEEEEEKKSVTPLDVDGGVLLARTVDSHKRRKYVRFSPPDVATAGFSGEQTFSWSGFKESVLNVYQCAYGQYLNCGTVIGGTVPFTKWRQDAFVKENIDPPEYRYLKRNNPHVESRVEKLKRKATLEEDPKRKEELVLRWIQLATWLPVFTSSTLLFDELPGFGISTTPDDAPKASKVPQPKVNSELVAQQLSRAALLHSTFTPFWLAASTSAFQSQVQSIHADHPLDPHGAAFAEEQQHRDKEKNKLWAGPGTGDEVPVKAKKNLETRRRREAHGHKDAWEDRARGTNYEGHLKPHEMDIRGMVLRPQSQERIFYADPLDWSYTLGVGGDQDQDQNNNNNQERGVAGDIFVVPIVAGSFGARTTVDVVMPILRGPTTGQGSRRSEWVRGLHSQLMPIQQNNKKNNAAQEEKKKKRVVSPLVSHMGGETLTFSGLDATLEDGDLVFFRRGSIIPRLLSQSLIRSLLTQGGTKSKDQHPVALFNPFLANQEKRVAAPGVVADRHHLVMEVWAATAGQEEEFTCPYAANWFDGFSVRYQMSASGSALSVTWRSAVAPWIVAPVSTRSEAPVPTTTETPAGAGAEGEEGKSVDHGRFVFLKSAEFHKKGDSNVLSCARKRALGAEPFFRCQLSTELRDSESALEALRLATSAEEENGENMVGRCWYFPLESESSSSTSTTMLHFHVLFAFPSRGYNAEDYVATSSSSTTVADQQGLHGSFQQEFQCSMK